MNFDIYICNSIGNREDSNGHYKLSKWSNEQIFLSNATGEGMGLSENELFELLDKYFKEKF